MSGIASSPARLDQRAGELAIPDIEVVRPLHAHRRSREIVEHLGGVEAAAQCEHVECARICGTLDERKPDARMGGGCPASPMPPAPCGLLVREDERARRGRRCQRVRDVECRPDGAECMHCGELPARREFTHRLAVKVKRAACVSGERQGSTLLRARRGTSRRRRSLVSG